jgi:hypothetical protein
MVEDQVELRVQLSQPDGTVAAVEDPVRLDLQDPPELGRLMRVQDAFAALDLAEDPDPEARELKVGAQVDAALVSGLGACGSHALTDSHVHKSGRYDHAVKAAIGADNLFVFRLDIRGRASRLPSMNRAKQIRLDRNLSVVEVIEGAGIGSRTLKRIEAGEDVNAAPLARLSTFYRIKASELLAPAHFDVPAVSDEAA